MSPSFCSPRNFAERLLHRAEWGTLFEKENDMNACISGSLAVFCNAVATYLLVHMHTLSGPACVSMLCVPDVGDPDWVTLGACCRYRKRDAPDMTSTQRSSGRSTRASRKLTPKLLSNLVSR